MFEISTMANLETEINEPLKLFDPSRRLTENRRNGKYVLGKLSLSKCSERK